MEVDPLVEKALAAFASGSHRRSREFCREIRKKMELPRRLLYPWGVSELRCADSEEEREQALAILDGLRPGDKDYRAAKKEIRSYLAMASKKRDLLQLRLKKELSFWEDAPGEAEDSGGLLVIGEVLGKLALRGEVPTELPSLAGGTFHGLIACFEKMDGDEERTRELARLEERVREESRDPLIPILLLWRARFTRRAGKEEEAKALYARLLSEHRHCFDNALEGWSKEIEAEAALSAQSSMQDEKLSPGKESKKDLAKSKSERARCLYDAGNYDAALEAWEASLALAYDKKILLRMAATAWHRRGDDSLAFSYLKRLRAGEQDAMEAKILKRTIKNGLIERIKKYVRLGLRRAAFEEMQKVRDMMREDKEVLEDLEDIFTAQLCSPWIKLLRERFRETTGLSFKLQEKDSPVWKLLRQARGKVDGESKNNGKLATEDPSYLPRIEKEAAMLSNLEERVMEVERKVLDCYSAEQFIGLLENRQGLEEFEQLLDSMEPILEKFASYSEKSHFEAKDFLASFLPGSWRNRLCNEDYLDVLRRENEVEHRLAKFIRKHYSGVDSE